MCVCVCVCVCVRVCVFACVHACLCVRVATSVRSSVARILSCPVLANPTNLTEPFFTNRWRSDEHHAPCRRAEAAPPVGRRRAAEAHLGGRRPQKQTQNPEAGGRPPGGQRVSTRYVAAAPSLFSSWPKQFFAPGAGVFFWGGGWGEAGVLCPLGVIWRW